MLTGLEVIDDFVLSVESYVNSGMIVFVQGYFEEYLEQRCLGESTLMFSEVMEQLKTRVSFTNSMIAGVQCAVRPVCNVQKTN